MANNFRLTGSFYVSKDGNDANSGATADLPKATLARYGSTTHIIGCGVYKGAFVLSTNGASTTMLPDGLVVINCTAALSFSQTSGANSQTIGQTSQNHFFFVDANGFNITIGVGTNNFRKVVFNNGVFVPTSNGGTHNFDRCILISITSPTITTSIFALNYAQVYNSTLTVPNTSSFKNCVFDAASYIVMTAYFATPSTQFINNCFMGIINIAGTLYELKKDKDGNAVDPNPAVNDLVLIDANVYTRGNFWQDPEFLNLEKKDFWSVANTSPLLFADQTAIGHIADVFVAAMVKASDTEYVDGTITNLVYSANDLVLDVGQTVGTAESLVYQVAPIASQIGRMPAALARNFNSSVAKGTAENNNITTKNNYTTGTAGANPRRLTVERRWSSGSAEPTVDADFDNNGYTDAGEWVEFELFSEMRVDVTGLGNGDPSYNPLTSAPIKAKWMQERTTVRDGQGPL